MKNLLIKQAKYQERLRYQQEGYCRIDIGLFNNITTLPVDVFVKINDQKYVRVFTRNTKIDSNDLKKFTDRGMHYLYLKSSSYQKVLSSFMAKAFDAQELEPEKAVRVCLLGHEMVSESISKLGLSAEAVEVASKALESLEKLAGNSKDFKRILKDLITNKNYTSEHSLMVTYLCLSVAKKIGWESEETTNKILVACFFHDITLDESFARCELDSLEGLSMKKLKQMMAHPKDAADLISQIDGIPEGVDKIILQHHEKPDGSGYPRKINFSKIVPLAALFIICEDFISCIYESGFNQDNLDDILEDFASKYNKGNFKEPLSRLNELYGNTPHLISSSKKAIA